MLEFFKYKRRYKKVIKGINNQLDLAKLEKCKVKICGNNNKIVIGDNPVRIKGKISIYGDNNTVIIGDECGLCFSVSLGVESIPSEGCRLEIGNRSGMEESNILICERNTSVTIGDDCMFSDGVYIWCSDTHAIFDQDNNILNKADKIAIGNHVWIGKGVKIGKNTKIADNSVVGWGSIVTKEFDEENVVIAGAPAKIVKRNINWSKTRPDLYE